AWELVRGIYMGGELPFGDRAVAVHAMKRLSELAALALEQIRDFADASKRHAAIGTFNDVENLMSQVGRLVPEVRPLIQWYETEKLRIPPGPAESVLESSQAILMRLNEICIHYEAAVQ